MVAILNFLSTLKSQHFLTTLIGAYVPSFIPIPSSVLEEAFLKDWPIRNFKVLWRQCLWRISTKERILVWELIGNITASLVSCSVFLKKKFEVWKVKKQTSSDGKSSHWPFARWVKMKTTLTNFLCQTYCFCFVSYYYYSLSSLSPFFLWHMNFGRSRELLDRISWNLVEL